MIIIASAIAYLLGSIPVGYILSEAWKGVDIRNYGSGNIGATNVYRIVGPAAGVIVLILDILKGVIAVALIGDLALRIASGLDPITMRFALAIAVVCGHNWTVFLGFKGGKGVATSVGALVGLSLKIPPVGLITLFCLGVWLVVLLATGLVSLSSLAAAAALPILMLLFNQPAKLVVLAAALCIFVFYRHKSNISKLLRGEEKNIFSAPKV